MTAFCYFIKTRCLFLLWNRIIFITPSIISVFKGFFCNTLSRELVEIEERKILILVVEYQKNRLTNGSLESRNDLEIEYVLQRYNDKCKDYAGQFNCPNTLHYCSEHKHQKS